MHHFFSRFLAVVFAILILASFIPAQELAPIKLNPPDKSRGLPFMQTVAARASATQWSDKELSLQDLSDLLWAANGLSRPEENKTTAPSALNAHDVDIFVFMKEGVFVYDFHQHELTPMLGGDYRLQILRQMPPRPANAPATPAVNTPPPPPPPANPPIEIILISDAERFRMGAPEQRYEWAALDAGIMSQNISLFCAATGLKTRPRASMDKDKIKELLKLKDTQYVFLDHPVGY